MVFELFESRPAQPPTKWVTSGWFAANAVESAATTRLPPAEIFVPAEMVKATPLVNDQPERSTSVAPVLWSSRYSSWTCSEAG